MAYKSKFLHFKTKASYNAERAKTTAGTEERKVFDAYISFIDEGPMICTWGKEYKCDISASEVEALVDAGKISPATVAPLPLGVAAFGSSLDYARADHVHPNTGNILGNAGSANRLATSRVIAIAGAVSGSATFDGSSNVSINSTLNGFDASKITSGTLDANRLPDIPIEKLPAGALERMFVVESQTVAIDAVKAGTIQEGDVVQIGNGGLMYFCIDDTATTFGNAFKEFTAGTATSVPWSGVTGKPSTYTPTLGTSSTTAYAGDKGEYLKNIISSIGTDIITGPAEISVAGDANSLGIYYKSKNRSGSSNEQFTDNEIRGWILPIATTSAAGILSAGDKSKLDTAYGWGNHASAGYAKTTQLANYLPLSGGTLTGGLISKYIQAFDTGKTDYNTTGKIGDTATYSTPILFSTSSAAGHWAFQFVDGDNTIFGKPGGKYVKITSNIDKSALSAEELYMGANLVATQSWVTGKGYLTSVPAQTWASITGKPSTFTPSAHTQSYTTLTGSTTTANQAIVSNGTANGWTLKTLGSNAFNSTSYIPTSVSVVASTLAAGSSATASYDASTNKFTFGIPRGATGATGATGSQGPKGDKGNKGDKGDTGATGPAGTYTAGANITISGNTISANVPSIPIALPNPYALTINGTSYTGSSAVSVTTSKPLTSGGNTSGTVVAGRNYNATSSSISSVSGFSYDNPDAVVGSSTKITSFPSSVRKMDGIADLSGSYYVYCFSYIGGYVYVNGAVYA